jgi:hypothetical protein
MNKPISTQAEGQLITAVSHEGESALLRLAESQGPIGELAEMALDRLTEPGNDLSANEAVIYVINKEKGR